MIVKGCRICQGGSKRCIFCGFKGDPRKKTKEEEERKEAERRWKQRMDHLGRIYNGMRKFNMQRPGNPIEGDENHNIALDAIYKEVVENIGDPLAPDAPEYIPYYKFRKNEVG